MPERRILSKEALPRPKDSDGTGVANLEISGEPYICGWPRSRRMVDLWDVPRQSVDEACAAWIQKAGRNTSQLNIDIGAECKNS